ncbi:hypothetical protein BT67DRAFT_127062 [Trichocladium antarcticum]|uniref:Uncharacterized protein n=1 Tax=Trichocladium antarcticum TaxID=1450529 RepID=A0AAN6ZHP6_9PEZI|nr:hypothetical protein BT67DRAFT_127062 [Trichocladium antarcticum]
MGSHSVRGQNLKSMVLRQIAPSISLLCGTDVSYHDMPLVPDLPERHFFHSHNSPPRLITTIMADTNTPNWLRPFSRLSRTSNPNLTAAVHNTHNHTTTDQAHPHHLPRNNHDNTTANNSDPTSSTTTTTTLPQIEPLDYPHNNHPHRLRPSAARRAVSSSLLSLNLSSLSHRARSAEDVLAPSVAMLPLTELQYSDGEGEDADGGFAMRFAAARVRTDRAETAGEPLWHNPNLMQMVEALRVVMMGKRDALEGLPVACNAYVLALIEGFAHLTDRLRDANAKIVEAKDLREKELEQFASISDEWLQREENYKAEIKRLELFLAKESKDGMASVALARSESVVDRAGSKRFHAKAKRVSNSQNQDVPEETVPQSRIQVTQADCCTTLDTRPRVLDLQNDILVSRIIERREREERSLFRAQARATRAAVRVGPRGVLKVRDMQHTSSEAQDHADPVVGENTSIVHPRRDKAPNKSGEDGSHGVQLDGRSRLKRQQQLLSGDTSSSDSGSSSTETPLSLAKRQTRLVKASDKITKALRGTFRQGGKDHAVNNNERLNGVPGPTSHQHPAALHDDQQSVPDAARGQQSTQMSENLLRQPPPPPSQDRSRSGGYSFDKGDDEFLPVTPTWASTSHTHPWPTGEMTARAQNGVEIPARYEDGGVPVTVSKQGVSARISLANASRNLTPSAEGDHDSGPLSSSTRSVRWLGSEDKNGCTTAESNTAYYD